MRKYIQINGIGELGAAAASPFGLQLLNAPLARTGNALVGAHHDALDAPCLV